MSWPTLEGLAAYLFLIALTWRVPELSAVSATLLGVFLTVGAGGALVALAYLRERTHERPQPRLHGTGILLLGLGTLGMALLPLF